MSSRDQILQKINQNKPELISLPENIFFESVYDDLTSKFCEVLKIVGGIAIEVNNYEEIKTHLKNSFIDLHSIASPIAELKDLVNFSLEINDPHDLESLNIAILKGKFGVAENGAVWITEHEMVHRILPFICQHLVLIIKKNEIVSDMHSAYNLIESILETQNVELGILSQVGFGVFIAGPSKTADIEQSLVIGAHGSRSLTVYILK